MRQPTPPRLLRADLPCYPAVGGIHMSDAAAAKRVRHFRQILLWPLQLMPLKEGTQVQRHWEVLHSAGAGQSVARGDRRVRRRAGTVSGTPLQRTRHVSAVRTTVSLWRRLLGPRRSRQLADARIPAPRHRRGARRSASRCAAGRTVDRARRSVLLLRHRRDAAERRGLRQTTCRSTSRRTSCIGSVAPIRPDGTRTARAFTRCIRSSGSRPTAPCWRNPIRAIERNS